MSDQLSPAGKIYMLAAGFIIFGAIMSVTPFGRIFNLEATSNFLFTIFGYVVIMLGLFIAIVGIYADRN